MRREVIVLLSALLIWQTGLLEANVVLAQAEEDLFGGDEGEEEFDEAAAKKREQERQEAERKRQEEEKRKAEEAKRASAKRAQEKERAEAAARERELEAYREASADTTEYTLNPDSVKLVVEMDPNGYGFRTRAHRMTMTSEFDFLLRGRSMLHYDFRFFNYLSAGILAGIDWTALSLYSRFRDGLNKQSPHQFSVLTGLSAKWRLTEWYMRSAIFLEPSLLFGYMWQTYASLETNHWRIRPGLFGGIETIFDSGLATSFRVGVEFPFDFGTANPIKEVAEPLFLVGLGLAI